MYPIDFFWRAVQRWPDRAAIDAPDGRVTYDQLAKRVRSVAAGLMAIDPEQQSRVGICASSSGEHIVGLLAVLASGKVWVPLNPKSTRPELTRITDAIGASILIVEDAYGDLLSDQFATRVVIGDAGSTSVSLQHLESNQNSASIPQIALPADATQAI